MLQQTEISYSAFIRKKAAPLKSVKYFLLQQIAQDFRKQVFVSISVSMVWSNCALLLETHHQNVTRVQQKADSVYAEWLISSKEESLG